MQIGPSPFCVKRIKYAALRTAPHFLRFPQKRAESSPRCFAATHILNPKGNGYSARIPRFALQPLHGFRGFRNLRNTPLPLACLFLPQCLPPASRLRPARVERKPHAARSDPSTPKRWNCSASHPYGSRSGHSVACTTSGLLRSTLPQYFDHRQNRKTFPDPAPPSQRRERMALPGLSFHRIPRCVPFQTPHTPILPAGELLSFRSVPELRRHFTRSPANALIRNL